MTVDPRTMLLLTLGIAVIAAGFLGLEWRALRERALALWSAGFAAIALGCSLSPLREAHSFLLGLWAANGLLVLAHLLFLFGTAQFVGRKLTTSWWMLLLPWVMILAMPADPGRNELMGVLNSALVAAISIRTVLLLVAPGAKVKGASTGLGFVFLLHGAWYCSKIGIIFLHGAYVDAVEFEGFAIRISLFEGIMVEVLLALLMAASVRRRREQETERLANLDPLTGVLNRRGFERRAASVLLEAKMQGQPCTLMLLDFDHFKSINDNFGHAFGDQVLIAFTATTLPLLPRTALLARLGGDEFVLLVSGIKAAEAQELGEAICSSFARAAESFENSTANATISMGAITFAGQSDLRDLLAIADAHLYEAKHGGRNRFCSRAFSTGASAGRTSTPRSMSIASDASEAPAWG